MLGISMFFISCENVDSFENSENAFDSKSVVTSTFNSTSNINDLYYQIVELEDTREQMLVASALTAAEMYEMWFVKIDDYKSNNDLNTDQLAFLTNLESILEPNLFIEDSAERENFDFEDLMVEAKNVFGENEGEYFLSKVENINHRIAHFYSGVIIADPNPTIEACDCNKNSNCTRLTGISIWGLSWEYGTCSTSTCYRETYLFGLIESSNNKRCTY